jgi:hypothetical protein
MHAEEILGGLRGEPLRAVDDARSEAEPLPGFYAWWAEQGALSGVPQERHAYEPCGLLYVGIAPDSERSRSSLRKRVRQHSDSAVGSSTFRYGLAALLCERAGWRPIWTDRPKLTDDDLAALGQWQRTHLQVSHPFYGEMGKARSRFRNLAEGSLC